MVSSKFLQLIKNWKISRYSYRSFFWINSWRNRKNEKDAEANAESDKIARERAEKLNEADGMIFQTETQLKN
jgi:molecular chaperone DnaK (HSP70)